MLYPSSGRGLTCLDGSWRVALLQRYNKGVRATICLRPLGELQERGWCDLLSQIILLYPSILFITAFSQKIPDNVTLYLRFPITFLLKSRHFCLRWSLSSKYHYFSTKKIWNLYTIDLTLNRVKMDKIFH